MNSTEKGRRGENTAAGYLEAHGYRIIQKNFKCRGGEVDIVAVRDDAVVFAEVKAWERMPFSEVERALGRRKQGRIRAAAQEFIRRYPVFSMYRPGFELLFITDGGCSVHHTRITVGG
ncbi:MAG: YraN family protein [Spirochaetota bacterium]